MEYLLPPKWGRGGKVSITLVPAKKKDSNGRVSIQPPLVVFQILSVEHKNNGKNISISVPVKAAEFLGYLKFMENTLDKAIQVELDKNAVLSQEFKKIKALNIPEISDRLKSEILARIVDAKDGIEYSTLIQEFENHSLDIVLGELINEGLIYETPKGIFRPT